MRVIAYGRYLFVQLLCGLQQGRALRHSDGLPVNRQGNIAHG